MSSFKKVDDAFSFLSSSKKPFSMENLAKASGWATSTTKSYLTKKLSEYLSKSGTKFKTNKNFNSLDKNSFR